MKSAINIVLQGDGHHCGCGRRNRRSCRLMEIQRPADASPGRSTVLHVPYTNSSAIPADRMSSTMPRCEARPHRLGCAVPCPSHNTASGRLRSFSKAAIIAAPAGNARRPGNIVEADFLESLLEGSGIQCVLQDEYNRHDEAVCSPWRRKGARLRERCG